MTAPQRQTWTAGSYAAHARFVSDLAGEVLEWLNPKPGEHILDLGCGDGVLTEELTRRGCQVVGVDTSEDLLKAAQSRGIDARYMDGQALTFANGFDAFFSNAALHWMRDAEAVDLLLASLCDSQGNWTADYVRLRVEATT